MEDNAFRILYERLAPQLRSYLRLLCRNAALADDLMQEAFIRMLHAKVSGLNDFQLKAYLYKAATSAATDYFRARKREQRWHLVAEADYTDDGTVELSYDMSRLFRSLTPQQQALLWLAYVEGFQHREIGEMLGLKEKSVRVVLFRARRQLESLLVPESCRERTV
jgi:RNA polymerase sigma-70 factor (ECF subfamily)